jgi:hypothetical protein
LLEAVVYVVRSEVISLDRPSWFYLVQGTGTSELVGDWGGYLEEWCGSVLVKRVADTWGKFGNPE